MAIKSDKWIKRMALEHKMIDPFEDRQVRAGVISYGLSSYGYDTRVADEFKVFTNVYNTVVDPKNASEYAFILYPVKNAEAVNKGKLPPTALDVLWLLERARRSGAAMHAASAFAVTRIPSTSSTSSHPNARMSSYRLFIPRQSWGSASDEYQPNFYSNYNRLPIREWLRLHRFLQGNFFRIQEIYCFF